MFLARQQQAHPQRTASSFIQQSKQLQKKYVKPIVTRQKYYQVYEWSKRQLSRFQKSVLQSEEMQISVEFMQQQKKIILSMLLQLSRICKQECEQKGFLVQEMLNFAISFMNQHQKYYDILSYKQIKNFQISSSELQKQYKVKIQNLRKELSALKNEKDQKWKNMFMVVKDNRILRRQKAKLLTLHRQQAWKIKLLEEDLISLRSQNQKYKLILQSYNPNENNFKTYISNHLLLNKLDEKIKKYPGKARSILKKQLFELEINQMNSLDEKIKFIIQSIEQNNGLCQQLDDWADHVETTRLFYNVSVQTYIETESVGINTITPVVIPKVLQSIKCQAKPRDLFKCEIHQKIYDIKLLQVPKKSGFGEKKRNTQLMSMTTTFSKIKKRQSIVSNSEHPIQETKHEPKQNLNIISSVINLKIVQPRKKNKLNKQFSYATQQNDEQIKFNDNEFNTLQSLKNLQVNKTKNKLGRKALLKKQAKFLQKNQDNEEEIFMDNEINKQYRKKSLKRIKKIVFNSRIFILFYEPRQKIFKLQQNIVFKQINSSKAIKDRLQTENKLIAKDQTLMSQIAVEQRFKVGSKKQIKSNEEETINQVVETSSSESMNQYNEKVKNRKSQYKTNEKPLKQIMVANNKANSKWKILKQKINKQHFKQKINQTSKQQRNQKENKNQLQTPKHSASLIKRHRRQFTQTSQYESKVLNLKSDSMNKKQRSLFCDDIQKMLPNIIGKTERKQYLKQKVNNKGKQQLLQYRNQGLTEIKASERQSTVQVNIKIIVFPESIFMNGQRLLQKLLSCIFNKRKQIIKAPQSLKSFIQTFLVAMVGQKNSINLLKGKPIIKFFASIKETLVSKIDSLYVCTLFQKMIALQSFEAFNQDIFVLFAIMLDKLHSFGALINISNIYAVSYQCSIKAIQYLCSIYFSPQQTQMFIKQFFQGSSPTIGVNMLQKFILLIKKIQNVVFDSQLWSLLSNCIPSWSNQHLSQTQILGFIWPIFLIYSTTQVHLKRIAHYSSSYFPLHRFCLYAHRYNWNEVYKIKTWINQKYLQYFQQFPQFDDSPTKLCEKIQKQLIQALQNNKIQFLLQNYKIMCFKYKVFKIHIDWSFLKLCRLCILMAKFQKNNIFPTNLNLLSLTYRKQIKKVSHLN